MTLRDNDSGSRSDNASQLYLSRPVKTDRSIGTNLKPLNLPIAELKDLPIQPIHRTDGRDMVHLVDSIREYGLVNPPYVARLSTGDYYKIDGHRRCAAYQRLGYATIPCKVKDVETIAEAERLFASVNGCVKRITGANLFEGWAMSTSRDGYLKSLRKSQAAKIRSFVVAFGAADSVKYALAGIDPCILSTIHVAHNFLSGYCTPQSLPTIKKVGEWVIRHKGANAIRELHGAGKRGDADRLLKCIATDKPYRWPKRRSK